MKNVFLKLLQNLQDRTHAVVSILIKVQALRLQLH